MTKDELIELRRERGKQEFNIGDKVVVYSASDKPLYDGKVATIIEKGISGNEVYYGLYIEGEIVDRYSVPNQLNPKSQAIGKTALLAPFFAEDLELVKEPTEKTHTITVPVKADLDDTYWGAYKAELAKELAVKLTNEETITSPATADNITDFATWIVDNLKKQSE